MTTEEHLGKILARCRELLALAENRTPGKWFSIPGDSYCAYPSVIIENGKHLTLYDVTDEEMESAKTDFRFPGMNADAAFIAACAGAAEAGWRATISMCEEILPLVKCGYHIISGSPLNCMVNKIIAAWPIELL